MKQMLWKELRENFKWALLGLIGLALAEIYALSTSPRGGRAYADFTLCNGTFLMVTSYGYCLFGAALGAVQILPELRRDQWAALLHRPVSRTVIFFGKAAAGVFLYLLATLLPFALSVGYVLLPGQFAAPLVPGMLIPGLSDAAFGLVFYFAAMFLCLYRGPWVARGALVLSLLPLFLLHITSGWPFFLPLGAALVFFIVSRAALKANGASRDFPTITRMVFVLIMLVGCHTAVLIFLWGLQFLRSKPDFSDATYATFLITRENQVLFSVSRGDGSDRKLTYPDGQPVTDPRFLDNEASFIQPQPFLWTINKVNDVERFYLRRMPRNSMNYLRPVSMPYDAQESWYYLPGQRYFVGYDKLSRLSVGLCDVAGFQPSGNPVQPFSHGLVSSQSNYTSPFLYWAGAELFEFDFAERAMRLLHTTGSPIYAVVKTRTDDEKRPLVAVVLDKELLVLNADGQTMVTLPLRVDEDFSMLSIATNPEQSLIYLQYSPGLYNQPSETPLKSVLDVVNLQGRTVQSYSLPYPRHHSGPDWLARLTSSLQPPLPALLGALNHHFRPEKFPVYRAYGAFIPSFDLKFSALPAPVALAAVLGLLAFVWARKMGFPTASATAWAILVFCFGLPGLLAFRLASDWPRRASCPQCQKPRSIEHNLCPHCRENWPVPARTGTEIFDQPANAA